MNPSIVAVSRQGVRTARSISSGYDVAVVYEPARFSGTELAAGIRAYEGKPAPIIAREFERGFPLVLVMAVGAAVRLIAPLLKDKHSDPPVVVVDDLGRYAISLVSGHTGGANRLAQEIAQILGAEAIVTTASEAAGIPSIEQIARNYGWWAEAGSNLTRLIAALINGDPTGVFQDAGDDRWLDDFVLESLVRYSSIEALIRAGAAAALVVTDRLLEIPKSLVDQFAIFRPPVLVLGIGCSTGASAEEVADLADATLARAKLSALSVFAVATIDRRREDPGLVRFAQDRRLQLTSYSPEELETTTGEWTASEIVRRSVGAGGVAEPAALRCAGTTSLVVRKAVSKHATVAVARVPIPSPDQSRHG
jgi:cobalt-precorrin 5A hydrolase